MRTRECLCVKGFVCVWVSLPVSVGIGIPIPSAWLAMYEVVRVFVWVVNPRCITHHCCNTSTLWHAVSYRLIIVCTVFLPINTWGVDEGENAIYKLLIYLASQNGLEQIFHKTNKLQFPLQEQVKNLSQVKLTTNNNLSIGTWEIVILVNVGTKCYKTGPDCKPYFLQRK